MVSRDCFVTLLLARTPQNHPNRLLVPSATGSVLAVAFRYTGGQAVSGAQSASLEMNWKKVECMDTPITAMEQVSPEWLTRVLQQQGVLPHGQVTAVHKSPQATPSITSLIARFTVSYSDNAPPLAPARLFLKISKPGFDAAVSARVGKAEVEFYTTVINAMRDPATVRCYDAVYASETGKSHVLLEDISDTHFQTEWPLPPLQPQCEAVMECLATFHACWWEHPCLGTDIGQLPTTEARKAGIADTHRRVRDFVDFLGDRLSVDRRHVYDKILTLLPDLWERHRWTRLSERKAMTLAHGDAHVWSFLYPRDAAKDHVRVIDWQFWHLGVGADDLAYLMALHWYPERRRIMESDLLKRYHAELLRSGVANYTWDECWFDYRVSALTTLLVPAVQWSVKMPAAVWWSHLERAMLAFHDLGCDELWNT